MSAATTTTLLILPPELHDLILSLVATNTDNPPAAVKDLISIGSTCRAFHHAVFCKTNDRIWRYPAYSLGVHSSLKVHDLLYPGSSQLQRHSWFNVAKLNYHLRKPFPTHKPIWSRVQKVSKLMPPPLDNSGFGSQKKARKRTVDMVISGEGTRKRTQYSTRHVDWRGDGSMRFMASNPNTTGTARQDLECVLDPSTARTDVLSCEVGSRPAWTATPFPGMAGYSFEKTDGSTVVREVGRNAGQPLRKWTLGEDVDRVVSFDDALVAAAFPVPRPLHSHIASRLVCAKTSKNGSTSVLWEINIPEDWADEDSYTRYPHVKNFHISKSHVVCLVTSHPNHRLGKLTRTEFRVLNIKTGYIERSIEISPKINASLGETNDRAPFTTAFKHDFLLTDTLIISGGPGGGLFVWDYSSNALDKNRLLYIIPDPWELDTTNTFPRQYSDITMSADGRLVAATTSDQLLIFDIIEKKLSGVYSNGRKVEQKDRYVSNPQDDFPGGMWCLFREWEGEDMRQETVAYLTDVPDEKAMARYSRSNLAVLFRRSLTESSPTWIGSNVYVSGVLVALGGVVISILIQKLCTSSGV